MKKPILCKFEPELIVRLKSIAKSQNRSVNNLIETVLMEYSAEPLKVKSKLTR